MIYLLLMGNHMKSCKEDVYRINDIFSKYDNTRVVVSIDCYPEKELITFLNDYEIKERDTFFIHYSGHGDVIGKRINEKMTLISTWINPDKTYVYSTTIDNILTSIKCNKIYLLSDSCHSGYFGNFYKGKTPLIFIGSSSIINVSNEYNNGNGKPVGILTHLLEKYHKDILYSDPNNIINLIKEIYRKYKITKSPVIKLLNM